MRSAMTFAEIFLSLMLLVGPHPGRTLYSQTPVAEGAPWVTLQTFDVDGTAVQAYRELSGAAPHACSQAGNPACRRPRLNPELKRWERPETWAEGLLRYWQIAQHAGALSGGDRAVLDYTYVILRHESGNGRRDVHEGTNHRPFRRSTKFEDGGRSWCLGQVMVTRHPGSKLPDKKFADRKAGELVGLDDAATQLCLGVVTDRVARIIRRCGRDGRAVTPACVFLGYAGSVESADHPLIRARIATYFKVRRTKTVLGDDVRRALRLPLKSKRAPAASVSFAPWRTSTSGQRWATLSGSAWMRSSWTVGAFRSRRMSYAPPPRN